MIKSIPVANKKNEPLPHCKKVESIEDLDIYLYESVNLINEELSQAIKIMLVGEVSTDKSTLLNCYLNYLLVIQFSDRFRYKIIYEDKKNLENCKKMKHQKLLNIK